MISVILAALLLMNTLGYYGIFFGLQYSNSVRMETAFDEGTYDESMEVTVRLPIAIPYNSETPFQRVDGTFEYKGEFYRLIKQRFVSDTLEVVLLKDVRHKEIQKDIVRVNDQNTSHNSVSTTIDFIKDYLPQTTNIFHVSEGWQMMLNRKPVIMKLFVSYHRLESPPPRQA